MTFIYLPGSLIDFLHLHTGEDEVTALHLAGVSVAGAFACAHWQCSVAESNVFEGFLELRSLFAGIAITAACVLIGIALLVPPLVARSLPGYELFGLSGEYFGA